MQNKNLFNTEKSTYLYHAWHATHNAG